MISPGCVGDLLEHRFQPLLELAAVLGSGHQRAHVQLHQALVLQPLGHVAVDDALRQPLDDGGLAHARLADQRRVVLGAPREDLHHAADFLVAPDHRVQLALARQGGQVAPVFLQRLVGVFRGLRGDPLRAAHAGQRLEDGVLGQPVLAQPLALHAVGQPEQDVLGGDVLVLHALGVALGRLQHIGRRSRKAHLGRPAVHLGALLQLLPQLLAQRGRAARHLGHQRRHHPLLLAQQCQQQVRRLDRLVVQLLGDPLGVQQRFLRFLGIFFHVHMKFLLVLPINRSFSCHYRQRNVGKT